MPMPRAPTAVQIPMAFARSLRGNVLVMIESVAGRTRAAPTPCRPRNVISCPADPATAAPLVPLSRIEIREPERSSHTEVLDSVDDLLTGFCLYLVIVGDPEPLGAAVVAAEPEVVGHDLIEDLTVGDGVLVPQNQVPLLVLGQQRDELSNETPRRVSNDYVRFFEQRDGFAAAEVSVTLQGCHRVGVPTNQVLNIGQVDCTVSVEVGNVCDLNLVRLAGRRRTPQPRDIDQW